MNDEIKQTLSMTAETIGKDILQALVQEIKLLPDVWPKLSQKKQDDVIDRLRNRVETNVKMAVHIVASEGKPQSDCPVMNGELCIKWIVGWKAWQQENNTDWWQAHGDDSDDLGGEAA